MAISTKKVSGDQAVHYVPPRKKRQRGEANMQPPLTPMIDVTFQLLLFFLLTFTFREAEGLIPGSLPQGDLTQASAVDPTPPIFITVNPVAGDASGVEFAVRGEHVPFRQAEELYQYLVAKQQQTGSDETPVVIEPNGFVLWEHVVNVFNQAVRAKYKKIGFATSV